MKERKPEFGDIVAVVWTDHFEFTGDQIPTPPLIHTWGKYDFKQTTNEGKDVVGIVCSEVQTGGQGVERRMTTQVIYEDSIIEMRKL